MAQVLHRYCLICAAGYWCQRRTAKYCSVACRMKAARLKGERERRDGDWRRSTRF